MSEHLGGAAGSRTLGTSEDIGDGSIGQESPQPEDFAFDAQSEREIERILTKYPPSRRASGAIPLLYVAQEQMNRTTGSGWVPRAAMDAVAARLAMPPIRVYEVATFYTMFNTSQVGRYHLQVCTTTPCWLRGSDDVVRACRDETGIAGWDEASADGVFSMSEVECLGACVNAPMLQVSNGDYYEDLDYDRTRALLQAMRRGAPPPPGSTIGRQASAPEGGPTTLVEVPLPAADAPAPDAPRE